MGNFERVFCEFVTRLNKIRFYFLIEPKHHKYFDMKKYLFFLLIFVLGNQSCTDLELQPEDAASEFEVFTNLEAYRSYLAKVYGSYSLTGQDGPHGDGDIGIVNDEGFTSYIRAYWKAQELTTDEAVIGWTDAGIRDLHEHAWSSENQFMSVLYYRIALIVSIANDFLKQSSDERLAVNNISDADQDEIAVYRAEARFLRALAYWHALDLFRNIALVQEITTAAPQQATPQELFDFIESELAEVEGILPAPRMNEYGRADQGAVWALQAKLYLNAESMIGSPKYTECITACNKILEGGYTLAPVYQTLFMKDNHTSDEIIFALNSDGKNTQNWGSTTFLVHGAIGGDMVPTDYGVSAGWGGLRTTSALINKFPDITGEVDTRAIFFTSGQSLEIDDIGEFTQGIAVPKYTNTNMAGESGSDPTHVDTDYPMFRLGDVHLMYAEAVLRNGQGGDIATAVSLINELRERAYLNDSGNIEMQDLTLPFILDERARELYWEANRRIDLVRFGQYSDGDYVWPWKGGVKEGRQTSSHLDVFPIPATDLAANPNMVQNTGY